MDKKELEETIINALENNSQWYETWDCRYRIIERRNFERVAQEVAAQILKTMTEDYRDLEPIPEHGNDFISDVSSRKSYAEPLK